MRPVVVSVFPSFTDRFEGDVRTMYVDVKNLVTIGRGDLIDPVEAAWALPFVMIDGTRADRQAITSEWNRVKNGGFAQSGWRAAAKGASMSLTVQGVNDLTLAKLRANDAILATRFAGWETLAAAVQLAVHSMAWACGPAFRFPRFEAALAARDYATCAAECHLDTTGNPGLVPRNAATEQLFVDAAKGCDPDTIPGWTATQNDVITEPELPAVDLGPSSGPTLPGT